VQSRSGWCAVCMLQVHASLSVAILFDLRYALHLMMKAMHNEHFGPIFCCTNKTHGICMHHLLEIISSMWFLCVESLLATSI